ncbi:hypothetical protein LCGC14_3098490 [marine sediment metagenome]|uniref:RNA ligase domain-containing protein n=1 Tax=marine sediment metagenome TaxID=412755 RepID=A0A0F8YYI3_9ZZZZ
MQYQKIQTVFLRDPETKYKTLLMGEYALPEFQYLCYNRWCFTEKVDGTNIRVYWDGNNVRFQGRTDRAQIPATLVARLQDLFPPTVFGDEKFNDGITLYGEGYGARIQMGGGNYKSDGVDFVLFDVRVGDWWLKWGDVLDVAEALRIQPVPTVGYGTLDDLVEKVQEGFMSWWAGFPAEGIVARPFVDLYDRRGHRIITKLKTKDFPSA